MDERCAGRAWPGGGPRPPLRREYAARASPRPTWRRTRWRSSQRWLADAVAAGLAEPNAMVVATVGPRRRAERRMVLLKGVDERGFVFFTNYGSRKGRELAANPRVALRLPVARRSSARSASRVPPSG